MRQSPSSLSSSSKSIFGIGTPDDTTMLERSSSTPSSRTPASSWLPPPRSPLGVDEEYDSAFKSKSFLDLWSHAHRHLMHTFSSASFKLASSSSSKSGGVKDGEPDDAAAAAATLEQSCSYTVLDDFVLEPSPEVLGRGRRRRRRRVERLLIEYFDVTQEACEACSSLLAAIGAARRHQLTLRRLLHRLEEEDSDDPAAARDAVAAHVLLDNPLSPGRLAGFHEVHGRCGPLAARLASAQRRLRRLARAMCVARGTAAAALVAACAAAVVAAVVFAAHAVVGVGAAAAAAGAGPATAVRWAAERVSPRHYARAGAAVDAAARGAYIVGRDLDTVSRMVRRAHDELEHGRDVARIAVRGRGERPLMQEVAREEAECEEDLRALLEELEEHVCLCLITINRSRRMVAHEMTQGLPPSLEEATPPPPPPSQD
ncbi:putative UPF0496 protein 2 [Sorghum bicolor]|uniref:Uncharacterized protein n=1 Tax=Sorghum bicolor TaxID=4558 RepID=A0A194YLS2_SORBI|nr:putative UPF0496 protein 2 [Sorghum bicolor]KXG20903.1 hypothetical protein SORBI_3010G268800 [Sorghum bicolor]|eukprot:XP_002439038.2 putative UPF0496 protein 2 [Sorghum bicolor]